MARKRHTAEDIINKMKEAKVGLARGVGMPEVCRKLGVTEQTYYRWRKEYGGLSRDQAKRLKGLEARVLCERWRVEYNTIRPHNSLNDRPPAPEAIVPWPGFAIAAPGARAAVGQT